MALSSELYILTGLLHIWLSLRYLIHYNPKRYLQKEYIFITI